MIIDWIVANIAWVLLIAIAVLAVAWVVGSRSRSRHFGHPTEFAGTMPEDRSHETHEALQRAYDRGEIGKEEFQRRSQAMDLGRE